MMPNTHTRKLMGSRGVCFNMFTCTGNSRICYADVHTYVRTCVHVYIHHTHLIHPVSMGSRLLTTPWEAQAQQSAEQ